MCDVIDSVTVVERTVVISFSNGKCMTFEDIWLRDNCRCPSCYRADTHQRAQHILDIPETHILQQKHNHLELFILWEDAHESRFSAEFLAQFEPTGWRERRRLRPRLWRGDIATKITTIDVNKFLKSVDGTKSVFQSLLDYGVVIIEGVGVSMEATEQICTALGGVQHTLFGGMWRFTAQVQAQHADTAYSDLPLAAHHDNTYFTEAAGLQILHCLEHTNGSGGDTILVDGFYGATLLKEEFPDDYKFLTTFEVEAEYIEEGHHHRHSAPLIHTDKHTGDITQIRFNVYDRSAMAFESSEQCASYYRSLKRLARYYEDADNQWRFKLKPGTVLAVDNFRVLHGRSGFTGRRVLCGSYVSRSDWLDKARTLRLIS